MAAKSLAARQPGADRRCALQSHSLETCASAPLHGFDGAAALLCGSDARSSPMQRDSMPKHHTPYSVFDAAFLQTRMQNARD